MSEEYGLTREQEIRVEALHIATDMAIARAVEYKRRPTVADVLGIVPVFQTFIESGATPPFQHVHGS